MAVNIERKVRALPPEVLLLTIPVQVLQDVKTERIYSRHSLNYPFIERNMGPNKLAEFRFYDKRWVMIAPHGGYTPYEHVMMMRWETEYTYGAATVPTKEGEKVMGVLADSVKWMLDRPYNDLAVFGFHSTPNSFEQEGGQSVTTMWHPYVFALGKREASPYISYIKTANLKHKDRKALRGGIYNLHAGRFLRDFHLNGHFTGNTEAFNQSFVVDGASVDYHGIKIPLRKGLEEILRSPELFGGVIQPIDRQMNGFADDMSRTYTDFDPVYVRSRVREAVENPNMSDEERGQILTEVTRAPQLLLTEVRTKNIQALKERGYSKDILVYMDEVNKRLPDSGTATRWKNGGGFTFAMCEDQETGQGFMAVSPIVENGPSGVVEGVLGAKLVRPSQPFTTEELARKKLAYDELVASF